MSNITCKYLKSLYFETHKLLQIFFQLLLHKILDITYNSGFKTSTFFFLFSWCRASIAEGMQTGNKPKYQWEYIVCVRFVFLNTTLKALCNDYCNDLENINQKRS